MAVDLTNTNSLVSYTSAVDTTTSSTAAVTRLTALPTNTVEELNGSPSVVGDLNTQAIVTNFNNLSGISNTVSATAISPAIKVGTTQPIGYKFNLPPHNWSLPLRPIEVDTFAVGSNTDSQFHGLRRGRLWYWVGANDITSSSSGNTTTSPGTPEASSPPPPGLNLIDTAWGFQFLWNPTTISTSVARNMDITPSSADTLRVVAGVFPGQETVSLSIVIDRTNDFACIKAESSKGNSLSPFTKYYTSAYPGASQTQSVPGQIDKLMSQGTMADLEYLFKAINGSGNGKLEWTNLLGKKTANVGYLAPTLLGIQLGPTLDNLSYVGWASNISINHTAFTEDMIPIRTEVGISIQCFAGSGLQSGA
jgi:hypothetical protein